MRVSRPATIAPRHDVNTEFSPDYARKIPAVCRWLIGWESLTGGSVNATLDSYAVSNNTQLLINTDGHLCTNHSLAFGSLDTVTYSGIGG